MRAIIRASIATSLIYLAIAYVAPLSVHAGPAPAPDFVAVGSPRELKGAPGIFERSFIATVGTSPFDKIGLHRLDRGSTPPAAAFRHAMLVVLYLPGTYMNGETTIEDPHYSFQVYLAEHGIDVWSFDYRTHFIPPTSTQGELGELAGWTSDIFESDIDKAVQFIRGQTGSDRIFVAGFSCGGGFAYLYAAMHPDRVKGLIVMDGSIPNGPFVPVASKPGQFATDVGGAHLTYDKRNALLKMVIENPDQSAPIAKYKTARENLERVLYEAGGVFGGHGGLANPQGGFSDATILAQLLIGYDRYWPAVQDYETPDSPSVIAALKAAKIPIVAFGSANIGPKWIAKIQSASKSTGVDPHKAKFYKLEGWGHLDVLAGTKSEQAVFAKALLFIVLNNPQLLSPD
ncbi:MAG TPA: alpha/beta fold hydrolase [Candidatus Binataceae bacterium]|nr:alpha/beta fold hydrolase [Candidatus Binataceae bacterium]